MTLGAAAVPVLGDPGPEEEILGSNPLALVEVEPTLAAVFQGTGVPAEGQALQTPPGELHQVLLQGVRSKGVLDLELFDGSRGPFGRDQELAVAPVEPGGYSEVGQGGVLEIPLNGPVVGRVHGQVMVGAGVGGVLLGVAGLAGLPAGVAGWDKIPGRPPAAGDGQQGQSDDGRNGYGEWMPGGTDLKQSGF